MTAVPFSMRMDAQLKKDVEKEARLEDRSASYVIQQATREYVERKTRLRAMVAELETEADKGEFISSESMRQWFVSLGSESEIPEPEPDVFLN